MTTEKINRDLAKLARPIDFFTLDERNARKHGPRDLETLKASLTIHGQQKPVVALASGKVIAGNGTLTAARALGWTKLAAVIYDDVDEKKARAFAIVDNRSAELSEWNLEELNASVAELDDLLRAAVGFSPAELAALAGAWPIPGVDPDKVGAHTENGHHGMIKIDSIPLDRRAELATLLNAAMDKAGFSCRCFEC